MRHFIIILLAFVTLTFCAASRHTDGYAGQLIYQVKDASHAFGCVLYKNVNYKEGQPCVQVLHGIGERGNGSLTDLHKPGTWPIFQALFQAADAFGFNVVIVQTANEYELGEIPYGYLLCLSLRADPNNLHLLCHSLGGYGFCKRVAENAAVAFPYATITITASGPGVMANTAKNLALAGKPTWLLTSADDRPTDVRGVGTNSGTDYAVTDTLFNRLTALHATVWETKYLKQGHNGTLSMLISAWGQIPNPWLPVNSSNATGLNTVKVSWYQWILNNHLTDLAKSPLLPYTSPSPAPVPHDTVYSVTTIQLPPVHDTTVQHDTVQPRISLKNTLRIFSNGSVQVDSIH